MITLKPTSDAIVLNPETGLALEPQGESVSETKYWRRRLADGSVVVVPESPKSSK
jgi:hypothetical protein